MADPPTPDQVVRNLVLSTLREPVMVRMNFAVGFIVITAWHYAEIAKLVEAGKIVVKSNPDLGHIALYYGDSKPPRIEAAPAMTDRGLIVHESTHAIFDMLRLTTRVQESEGFGYLSQALYGWLSRGGPPASRYIVSHDPTNPISEAAWQLIFDESARLAGILSTKSWISEDDAKDLYAAVSHANIYVSRVGNVETNDGI